MEQEGEAGERKEEPLARTRGKPIECKWLSAANGEGALGPTTSLDNKSGHPCTRQVNRDMGCCDDMLPKYLCRESQVSCCAIVPGHRPERPRHAQHPTLKVTMVPDQPSAR